MVICTSRTLAALKYTSVVSEVEWTKAQKALDFLDLADHSRTLFEWYKKNTSKSYQRSLWIRVSSSVHNYPIDDCRPLFKWSNDKSNESIFFDLCIKNRYPDFIGRNIFMEYMIQKFGFNPLLFTPFNLNSSDMDSSKSIPQVLYLATLCGFWEWRTIEIYVNWEFTEEPLHQIILSIVYPSVLIGIKRNKKRDQPLLTKNFFAMFGDTEPIFTYNVFKRIRSNRHLKILLGAANQASFTFYTLRYDDILNWFIKHKRFKQVTIILRHGYTFHRSKPLELMWSVSSLLEKYPIGNTGEEIKMCKKMFRMIFFSLPSHSLPPSKNVIHSVLQQKECIESIAKEMLSNGPIESLDFNDRHFYECLHNYQLVHECNFSENLKLEIRREVEDIVEDIVDIYEPLNIDTGLRTKTFRDLVNDYECNYVASITDYDGLYKLKHLCRCAVRKVLRNNFQLPNGINGLGLPRALKKYLNLGC